MVSTDTKSAGFTPKADARDPLYKALVAEPMMEAIDGMPPAFRRLVHEFDYIGVYRAWRRGWSVEAIRAHAAKAGGIFRL